MWFGVLGRLEVRRADGTPVRLAGPARRRVLAALLCRRGAHVSAVTLIDDIWSGAPPRTAPESLRVHVMRLRQDLGRDEVAEVLITEGDGYRLRVEADDLDAGQFEALVSRAQACPDGRAALGLYDEALGLWRDEAFLEFGDAPFAVVERVRLAEARSAARERRTDLALELGMSGELVAELEQRVRAAPYRERGWEQLSLALYRNSRQADALQACRRARAVLVEDLGVDPGPALRELEARILRQEPGLLHGARTTAKVGRPLTRCPYLGLAGYHESDAALFVGRERITSILASRLADQSVVVVTGASGVGKSSLLRAGLVPALRSGAVPGSATWRIGFRTPAQSDLELDNPRLDLLVLDQAEELFTAIDAETMQAIAARLARFVADHDGRLVLIVRSDFYGRLAELDSLAPFAEKSAILIGPLRTDELRRVLVEPAEAAGVSLEDELVETVLDDVAGQPQPLPLLSEAMLRTWRRRDGDVLRLEAYRQAGELAGALEAAAEECYAALGDAQRRAARHLLVRMATRAETGWLRRPLRVGTADPIEQQVLTAFISARLLVASEDRIDLAHDALLAHWPRLRGWLEERTIAADMLQHLADTATAWRVGGRQDADLYRGLRLTAAAEWRDDHPDDISPAEAQFLDASSLAAQTELEKERRARGRLRRTVVALGAVLVVAIAGAVVALIERGTAARESMRAEQAALAADARRLAALSGTASDIATSSLLAVVAYRLQDSPETRGALLDAVERNQSALWRMPTAQRPQHIVAALDGSRLVMDDNRSQITVVDPRTRRRVATFTFGGYRAGIPFGQLDGTTAEGQQVITMVPDIGNSSTGRLIVTDVSTTRRHVLMNDVDVSAGGVVTTLDGRWVAVATTRHVGAGTIIDVLDTRDWNAPALRFVTAGPSVKLVAGRTALAVEHADGSVDVRSLPALKPMPGMAAASVAGSAPLAVSADGSSLAAVDPHDSLRADVFDLRTGAETPIDLPAQAQSISVLRFSPDGSELAVGSYSGWLGVYGAAAGNQLNSFAGHDGPVQDVAWTGRSAPTGLYSVGLDGQLISWDLGNLPRTVRQTGPDHVQTTLAQPFGRLIIGYAQPPNSPDSQIRIFTLDRATGRYFDWPAGLRDDEGSGQVVASDDGKIGLASITAASGVNRIAIVDLRAHDTIGQLALPPGSSNFADGLIAAISPDGRSAYSSLGRTRIGVFALPSGRYLRSFEVHFADPDAGRVEIQPIMFDPAGRLMVQGYDPGPSGTEPWARSGPPLPRNQRLGLVDLRTDRLVAQTRLGDIGFPSAIAWSNDARSMAIGTSAGTLGLYDADTLSLRTTVGRVSSGFIDTASFSPDDRTLETADSAGSIVFWSVPALTREGARLVLTNSASIGGVGGVFAWYAPDGDVVGLAADDRRPGAGVRWFDLQAQPAALVRLACDLAGGDITRAQWRYYIGDRPYQHVCTG